MHIGVDLSPFQTYRQNLHTIQDAHKPKAATISQRFYSTLASSVHLPLVQWLSVKYPLM
jgi:hypothetical protein